MVFLQKSHVFRVYFLISDVLAESLKANKIYQISQYNFAQKTSHILRT